MSYDIQPSDSENYDQLMNKGWLSMSEILEVELPQKKKRRLGIYFWLCIIFLALSSTFYLITNPSNNSLDKLENAKSVKKQIPLTLDAKKSNDKIKQQKNDRQIVNSKKSTITNSKNYATLKSNTIIGNSDFVGKKYNNIDDNTKNINELENIIEIQNRKIEVESNETNEQINESNRLFVNESDIQFISNLKFLNYENSLDLERKFEPIKKVKNNHFIAEAGVNYPFSTKFFGVQAGFLYNFELSKKWNIYSGLNYNYQFSPFQPIKNYSFAEIEPTLNTSSEIVINEIKINYHQIRVPIGASYQFYKKWCITVGISMIYERPILTYQNTNKFLSADMKNISSSSYPKVNSFSMSFDAGISYRLNKLFTLKSGMMYYGLPLSNSALFYTHINKHIEGNLVFQYHF